MIHDREARVLYRAGPTALALLFALVAWPLVALTMSAVYPVHYVPGPELPASPLARWSAAASAVFLSALVAGPIGGLMVRRRLIAGGLATFAMALAVAIASLPLLPILLGQQVGVGCQSAIAPGLSSSPCDPLITTTNLANNLQAVPFFWLAPFVEPVPVLVLAAGVSVWTAVVTKPSWLRGPIA
jgi:hypothetical protein